MSDVLLSDGNLGGGLVEAEGRGLVTSFVWNDDGLSSDGVPKNKVLRHIITRAS